MAEGLEYRFKEETTRGTPLEVTAPKLLVDEVTWTGPLRAETLGHPDNRVLGRKYDGQGNITLDFDLNTNGLSYFHGPAHIRSGITLAIIVQLDMAAQRRGLSDPRVSVAFSPRGTRHNTDQTSAEENFFKVSFESPGVDSGELAEKVRHGTTRFADLTRMYNGSDHTTNVVVTPDEAGLELRMGYPHPNQIIMTTDAEARAQQGRINLFDPQRSSSEERLAALVGIIAALDPLRHLD